MRVNKYCTFKTATFTSKICIISLIGVPGFRRKTAVEKMTIISTTAALFPFYCLMYMIFPYTETAKIMRKPFFKFLIHASSYLFFLCKLFSTPNVVFYVKNIFFLHRTFSHIDSCQSTSRSSSCIVTGNGYDETSDARSNEKTTWKSPDTVRAASRVICFRFHLAGDTRDFLGGHSKLFEKHVEFY